MERLNAAAENSPVISPQDEDPPLLAPAQSGSAAAPRHPWFRWYVCVLLLLATTINYMDRQTLANTASRIKSDFQLSNEQYGEVELWFGLSFAAGSLVFGFLADRSSLRLLYPAVLVAWSLMGIATGSVTSFYGLIFCRSLLGWFEAGHWPCALKTTQRLLPASQRTLGNSILQSGSSIGAIFTPLIVGAMLTPEIGSWRLPFQIIGALGIVWVGLWLSAVRKSDLPSVTARSAAGDPIETKPVVDGIVPISLVRRFAVLVVVVVTMNTCWHVFRVWLPLFLQEGRGYSEQFSLGFSSAFYLVTDVGCFAAGAASIVLHRLGVRVGFARWLVFGGCSLLTALSVGVAYAPAGSLLLGLLLLVGAGSLGQFPCYYALSQELSVRHQGKITGTLARLPGLPAPRLTNSSAGISTGLARMTGASRWPVVCRWWGWSSGF